MAKVAKKKKIYRIKPAMIGQIAIIGSGGSSLGTYSCKDEAMTSYKKLVVNTFSSRPVSTTIPEFAYWTKADTVERNAKKFQLMINRLERRIGIEGRTVCFVPEKAGKSEKTACFIVRTHEYWIRHPLRLSAFFIIMCQTRNMKMFEGFKTFARRMVKEGKTRDAKYFKNANTSGSLDRLMNGSLPGSKSKSVKNNWKRYNYGVGFASYRNTVEKYKKAVFA